MYKFKCCEGKGRRSIRLKEFDYAARGAYFVTICTQHRGLTLQKPEIAGIMRQVWESLPARFPGISLDEFVLMPNHVHFILWITPPVGSSTIPVGAAFMTPQGAMNCAPTLGEIMRHFKAVTARGIHKAGNIFAWQRNYYEHIIRNDDDLNLIRQYIRDNPAHGNGMKRIRPVGVAFMTPQGAMNQGAMNCAPTLGEIQDNPARWERDEENPSCRGGIHDAQRFGGKQNG